MQLGSTNLVIGFLVLFAYLAATGKVRSLFLLPTRDLVSSLSLDLHNA